MATQLSQLCKILQILICTHLDKNKTKYSSSSSAGTMQIMRSSLQVPLVPGWGACYACYVTTMRPQFRGLAMGARGMPGVCGCSVPPTTWHSSVLLENYILHLFTYTEVEKMYLFYKAKWWKVKHPHHLCEVIILIITSKLLKLDMDVSPR